MYPLRLIGDWIYRIVGFRTGSDHLLQLTYYIGEETEIQREVIHLPKILQGASSKFGIQTWVLLTSNVEFFPQYQKLCLLPFLQSISQVPVLFPYYLIPQLGVFGSRRKQISYEDFIPSQFYVACEFFFGISGLFILKEIFK